MRMEKGRISIPSPKPLDPSPLFNPYFLLMKDPINLAHNILLLLGRAPAYRFHPSPPQLLTQFSKLFFEISKI
jgi:hypothetical protein